MPGYPAVSLSLLAARLGAGNRLIGLIVAAVTGCVLLLGEIVLNLVPTPLLGSLLVWIGAAVTYEWLVLTARRLALWEYLTVVLIFLVIVGVSFTTGILVGLVAAIILFVVEYGRVDSVRHVLTGENYQSTFEMSEERREALRGFGQAILIVRLHGFIFFGTADRLRKKIEDRLSELVRFLIIDFRHVTGVDLSAVVSFVRLGKVAVAPRLHDGPHRDERAGQARADARRPPRRRAASASIATSTTVSSGARTACSRGSPRTSMPEARAGSPS